MGPDAVGIFLGARHMVRSRDTDFPFRQDSDFWYLTGFDHPNAVAVLRKGQRKSVAFPNSSIGYELLTPDLRRRASLLWLTAAPGAESGMALTHEGEDVVVVLRGRLSIEVGGEWHALDAGDSIFFSSELPHRWCNRGEDEAQAIWVSSPPSF